MCCCCSLPISWLKETYYILPFTFKTDICFNKFLIIKNKFSYDAGTKEALYVILMTLAQLQKSTGQPDYYYLAN